MIVRMTREQRMNQEAEMFQLGIKAAEGGANRSEWPRIGKKYSSEWYRCKSAWLHGHASHYHVDSDNIKPIDSVPNVPVYAAGSPEQTIQARLVNLILTLKPVTVRTIIRKFSTRHRAFVRDTIALWYDRDILEVQTNGKKTSATTILGFTSIPDIYMSPQQGDSPASTTPDTIESDRRENSYAVSHCMMSDPRTQKALGHLYEVDQPTDADLVQNNPHYQHPVSVTAADEMFGAPNDIEHAELGDTPRDPELLEPHPLDEDNEFPKITPFSDFNLAKDEPERCNCPEVPDDTLPGMCRLKFSGNCPYHSELVGQMSELIESEAK